MTATTDRRTLPPVACQPWCSDKDGHAPAIALEDQWCGSEELLVPLTLQTDLTYDDRDISPVVYALSSPVDPLLVNIAHDSTDKLPYFSCG